MKRRAELAIAARLAAPGQRPRSVVSESPVGRRRNHAADAFRLHLAQFSQHMALPDLPVVHGSFTARSTRVQIAAAAASGTTPLPRTRSL